jgi:hypothetical protein
VRHGSRNVESQSCSLWNFYISDKANVNKNELDNIPDVRDGLTRKERIVLYCINQLQKERDGRNAPTVMLYGRVLEYVEMSESELQLILQRLSNSNSRPVP